MYIKSGSSKRHSMNKPKQNIFTSICYCFALCFQSSSWLTLVRLGGRLFRTVQALISAYLMKLLLDLLADPGSLQTHMQQLYLALGAMAGLVVLNALMNKVSDADAPEHVECVGFPVSCVNLLEIQVKISYTEGRTDGTRRRAKFMEKRYDDEGQMV